MIDVSPDIDSFFEQVVSTAMEARRVDATGAAQHYLVSLLSEYARGQPTCSVDQPFTFQLRDALAERGAQRFERLRGIGDQVLYVLGFFGRNLERRGADPEYVMSVGSSAYGHASAMIRACGTPVRCDVLSELSESYASFVAVVSEVADGALAAGADDSSSVLRLYERWQATASPTLAATLVELGLCPVRGDGSLH